MNTEAYLKALRRKLSEVDQATSLITDSELLDATEDGRRQLAVRKVAGFSGATITIQSDSTSAGYGITPDLADDVSQVLLLRTTIDILQETYTDRLNKGEMGVSWQSGLEQESTISAEKAYRQLIKGVQDQLDELSLIRNIANAATRPQ